MPTVSLNDGRILGFERWGDPDGQPLCLLHGTPGCRLSRFPDEGLWSTLGIALITIDRPGYGLSSALPERRVSHAARDVAAVADAIGVERFMVSGGSGGGPHALACAAVLTDRVRACAAVASAAPLVKAELDGLIGLNRESYRILTEEGRTAMGNLLGELREQILADPIAATRAQLADAPPEDLEWLGREDVQRVQLEAMVEALRPGVQGWVDDAMSLFGEDWDIDLGAVECPVRFWHSANDKNGPLSAIERLVERVPGASLHVWRTGGHTAPSRYIGDVMQDLIAAAAAPA
jgi:pimeloyl-ACP methyl ester carboxylesterase